MKNILLIALFLFPLSFSLHCGSSSDTGGGGGGGTGCTWNSNCSSTAPNGAYDCFGSLIVQCNNGTWETVVGCLQTDNSDSGGSGCLCSGGCGTATVSCSWAGSTCEGQSYETCGANATRTLVGNSLICVED